MKNTLQQLVRLSGYEFRRFARLGHAKSSEPQERLTLGENAFQIEFSRVLLNGSIYFVPGYAKHRPAVQRLLGGELFEPRTHKLIDFIFSRFEGSLVHAGTFFGDMLPTFSAAVTGNVYAFEPVLENYILANLCMQHNELKNVLLFHSALGAETQNLRINTKEFDGQHRGGASAIDSVGSLCLANSIDSLPIQNLTMIQLDIEGFELQALLGATDTIREQRPIVAIEDNHNNCSEFLDNSQYEHRLSIPGLEIWSPAENIDYAEALAAFAQSFSTPA